MSDAEKLRWLAMPEAEWDGETPLWSTSLHEFLGCADEVWDAVEEHCDELGLVICEPVTLRPIDVDYWDEDLWYGDGHADLPQPVLKAMEALNKAIEEAGPVTWRAGRYRCKTPKLDDAGG